MNTLPHSFMIAGTDSLCFQQIRISNSFVSASLREPFYILKSENQVHNLWSFIEFISSVIKTLVLFIKSDCVLPIFSVVLEFLGDLHGVVLISISEPLWRICLQLLKTSIEMMFNSENVRHEQ